MKFYSSYIWILLGFASAVVKMLTANTPEMVETYYSKGLYLGIRKVFDYSLSNFPFPSIYLFFGIFALLLLFNIRDWYRNYRAKQLSFSRSLRKFVGFLGALVFFFFSLWGYNYNRLPVEKHMSLEVRPLKLEELKNELELETKELVQLRQLIKGVSDSALTRELFPEDLEIHLRENLAKTLNTYDYPSSGNIRGRLLYPQGVFLRFSSAGLYFPYVGEGNIDAGLHPIQWPFVMSHEMSHAYGFADEGTCNFWAYLSTTSSPHPAVAYVGHLSYWRTLAIQYLRYEPEAYGEFRRRLPDGIKADLTAINEQMQKFPDFIPDLQPKVYNAYLKAQGIKEGVLNYKRVVMLVHAWRQARKS